MILSSALQLLIVVSADWNAVEGNLYRYQRLSHALEWTPVGQPIEVSLGKNGMAWGRGLHPNSVDGMQKQEGDSRSPAGLFRLGPAFGDAFHQKYADRLAFLLLTDDLECIDDADSTFYNQFVKKSAIAKPDWKSSEKMKSIGFMYAIGLVVQHNTDPIQAGMGSAIFIHVWRNKGEGTHGCTAMQEEDLNAIVSWLDHSQHPCLVQMPLEEYQQKKAAWGLPNL